MNKKGFTLVELLIVIIIVGVLASVAIPIMSGITKRAVASEAISMLGMIRTAEKAYYLEHHSYTNVLTDLTLRLRQNGAYGTSDLDGTYVSEGCFSLVGITISTVYCKPLSNNSAPQSSIFTGWSYTPKIQNTSPYIAMDQDGNIYSNYAALSYPLIN